MSHAKSLRVIGQTLEAARVTTFKLEKHAQPYRLWIADRLSVSVQLIFRASMQRRKNAGKTNLVYARQIAVSAATRFGWLSRQDRG